MESPKRKIKSKANKVKVYNVNLLTIIIFDIPVLQESLCTLLPLVTLYAGQYDLTEARTDVRSIMSPYESTITPPTSPFSEPFSSFPVWMDGGESEKPLSQKDCNLLIDVGLKPSFRIFPVHAFSKCRLLSGNLKSHEMIFSQKFDDTQ
ncbi:hypothetical protein AVEN_63253-1 [Araneus ventricosus]|uniref:Uncharacterized protein n=1 Tax=Araneus ventricosus TaxID=182803 RepID=A0A4Y2B1C4_ARAVE|nr:hypothetical protein AVEN_63253-1 [Araneus ventricosus]